jgi:nickel superoxide dismutase
MLPLSLGNVQAHCQVPCGIYDDQMRTEMIAEHITTIEKAMKQIVTLSKEAPLKHNQIVRWVINKESHATEIQGIISDYFMAQRIKTDAAEYEKKLGTLHQLLVGAMKCKQSTDLAHVDKMRLKLKEFEKLYFGHSHRK